MNYFIVSVIKREMRESNVVVIRDGDLYDNWEAAKRQVDLLVRYNPDNYYAIASYDRSFTGIVEVVEG